ncbi:MAG: hypothetical protein HN576_16385 [Bacteriovoracaceae bacterium]|jgi:hypothetical protein|nr:hypothetical protein [Bacteriovoracaceae bacterium]
MRSCLSGKIELSDLEFKKNIKKYDVNSGQKEISMAETFMTNFSDIELSEYEKQHLTQANRCELIHYKSITFAEVESFARQLLSNISSNHSEMISIKASGFGAYVCLAAITSQELPKNKKYQIVLEGFPLMLYPKDLMKTKRATHNVEITYTIEEESWLNSFSSLTAAPDHLNQIDQLMDLRMNQCQFKLAA